MANADLDAEVAERLATDPHYPLGEPDAMKWAVTFRLIATGNGRTLPPEVTDNLMRDLFASAMADFNGDAMDRARRFCRWLRGKSYSDDWADEGLMVGWFANCMATGELQATGGSFLNADGMQSIIDGELEAHPEFCR